MNDDITFSNDANWERMLRYLDGTLPDEEVAGLSAALRADPALRREFADLLRQQLKLEELLAERHGATPETVDPEKIIRPEFLPATAEPAVVPLRSNRRHWLAAAAVLTLSLVGAWFWSGTGAVAVIESASSGATVTRDGGDVPVAGGLEIRSGDVLTTGSGAVAVFTYEGEATRITLESGARLTVEHSFFGKRLDLADGSLVAEVAPQGVGRPMILTTPTAEARVLGTRFRLNASKGRSRLEVFEGRVRFESPETPAPLVVRGGYSAELEPGRAPRERFIPEPVGRILFEGFSENALSAGGTTGIKPAATGHRTRLEIDALEPTWSEARLRGFLHPPLTGYYNFSLQGEADAELWLSTDDKSDNAVRVLTNAGETSGPVSARPVELRRGEHYYIELRRLGGAPADAARVTWRLPDGRDAALDGRHLSPLPAAALSESPPDR